VAKSDLGALPLRFERQQLIEARPRHLISITPTGGKLVVKIEFRVLLTTPEGRAVLDLKTGALHRAEHARLFKIFHALRQQTLADAKTWKLITLNHQNSQTLAA